MFGKALEIVSLGRTRIDEKILLGFDIVKDQGLIEIKINLARISIAIHNPNGRNAKYLGFRYGYPFMNSINKK